MAETKIRKPIKYINRLLVLFFIIIQVIAAAFLKPVRPMLAVAPEAIVKEPLFTLPVIGAFHLTNTHVAMLIGDLIIILAAWLVYRGTRKGSLVPSGISGVVGWMVEAGYNLTESTAGRWTKKIFPWFATILILVLVANLLKLLPGFETIGWLHHAETGTKGYEAQSLGGNWYNILPTTAEGEEGYIITPFLKGLSVDLNFTVALALISIIMTQIIGIQAQGLRYFSKFLNFTTMFKKPFLGFMDLIVGLLELVSELAKILSFSFRLFGVMFAGVVLVAVIGTMVPVFVPSLLYMFELFMGVIQAFVFGLLTMVFMSMATQGHGSEEHAH